MCAIDCKVFVAFTFALPVLPKCSSHCKEHRPWFGTHSEHSWLTSALILS